MNLNIKLVFILLPEKPQLSRNWLVYLNLCYSGYSIACGFHEASFEQKKYKCTIRPCYSGNSKLSFQRLPSSSTFLNSGKISSTTLPFSEAVLVDNTLYLSGQIGVIPGSLKLAVGGIRGESKQTLENIKITLLAHGFTMKNLLKCTVMLTDIKKWDTFDEV